MQYDVVGWLVMGYLKNRVGVWNFQNWNPLSGDLILWDWWFSKQTTKLKSAEIQLPETSIQPWILKLMNIIITELNRPCQIFSCLSNCQIHFCQYFLVYSYSFAITFWEMITRHEPCFELGSGNPLRTMFDVMSRIHEGKQTDRHTHTHTHIDRLIHWSECSQYRW